MRPTSIASPRDTMKRDELAQAIFVAWVSQGTSPESVLARPELAQQQAEAAFQLADQFMAVQRGRP